MNKILLTFLVFIAGIVTCWAQSDPPYPAVPPALQQIVAGEYALDTDPGFGNGTPFSLSPGTDIAGALSAVNTGSLSAGSHLLFWRTRNAEGSWSLTSVRQLIIDFDPAYPAAPPAVQTITRVEYTIDAPPVFGTGTAIPITPATDLNGTEGTINTNLLTTGAHSLFIAVRNGEGKWSIASTRTILVDENPAYPAAPPAAGSLNEAEYFFDTDPGIGNGTRFNFPAGVDVADFNLSIPTSGLTVGAHQLYVRILNPVSLTSIITFNAVNGLPLSLLSFKATVKNNQAVLEALTTDEVNTSHIELERSRDAIQFSRLSSLPTHNTIGTHRYEFIDPQPVSGINYYRLKLLDLDGKFSYSRVLALNTLTNGKLRLSPNPVQRELQVSLPRTGNFIIAVYTANGQLLLQRKVSNTTNLLLIDLSTLARGQYWLKLYDGTDSWTQSFLKE